MQDDVHDTDKTANSRAREEAGWVEARNGGRLRPFRPGEGQRTGYRKPNTYVETLHLARRASPAAMRTLIRCLDDPDSRTAVVAAERILERAFGKPREQKPAEQEHARIDLSSLSDTELAVLMRLVESGRLKAAPEEAPTEIEGVAAPVGEGTNVE